MSRLRGWRHLRRLASNVRKIETLSKTEPHVFFMEDEGWGEGPELARWMENNGIKAAFLDKDIKMLSGEDVRNVIVYLGEALGQKTDKACDFA